MFGLLKLCLRNTVVYDTGADSNISGVVPDLQTSYSDTTVELTIDRQIANSPAVVAAFGFFQQTYQFHCFDLRRSGKRAHIHRCKIRTQRVKLSRERALDITN